MQFKPLLRNIERSLRMEGTQVREQLKVFVNDAILDFIRMKEWSKVKDIATFTLDGSSSYDIAGGATPIAADFEGEIELLNSGGERYQKMGYHLYIGLDDKSYMYSIFGDKLYIEGDNEDFSLMYIARGAQYPLVQETDEVLATLYYDDIIQYMVIVRFLKYLGDDTWQVAEQELQQKLVVLRASENRIGNNGKPKHIQR